METLHQSIRNLSRFGIFLLVALAIILAIIVGVGAFFISQPGSVHYRCSDFGSYQQMCLVYDAGAKYLDKNKDGKPCQSDFPSEPKC